MERDRQRKECDDMNVCLYGNEFSMRSYVGCFKDLKSPQNNVVNGTSIENHL